MAKLTILIADDHKIVRDGLRALIETNISDAEIVGESSNGRDAVRSARRLKPDIVIMDVSMPELNGLEAVRQLTKIVPDSLVIVLSMHNSQEVVAQLLTAGARAYVHKGTAFDELERAIRAVAEGDVYVGTGIADSAVEEYLRAKDGGGNVEGPKLSAREREVFQLIAEGHRTRDIATLLHISPKTVETHRSQIFRKLNVDNVAQLTRYAIRTGVVSLHD